MSKHPVETYLRDLQEIEATGGATPERSYYPALGNLLNEVGRSLKPRVKAVLELADTGKGHPDFGLYSASQFKKAKDDEPVPGLLPERGVVEVKPWSGEILKTSGSKQVSKYWKKYNLVLVTNFREFLLIGRGRDGKPQLGEPFVLAKSAQEFVEATRHPKKAAGELGDQFLEYLRRAMLQEAALSNPEDLAWFLASYAREARSRIEEAADLHGLTMLREVLEEALGMKFEGEKGEHFFRSTLVQTLFYGIFSAWVLWSRSPDSGNGGKFDWKTAAWNLKVPMIGSLFEQIATPKRLKPLRIDEVLDWAGQTLNRVDRDAFFQKFEQEYAVQYFYEPFLKAFDPELKKQLGVWYTPPEIVKYQVERVDRVLREELKLADGLADKNVVVLDPCCGTGAYLVETLKRIHYTLEEKGGGALLAESLKKAACERVFGFEILPAPFVISHLQIGLLMQEFGAPFASNGGERAGVYLTNALTGWDPPEEPKPQLPFPEFEQERDQADRVKQEEPIIVIIGNPPYNAFAGTSPKEEGDLVAAYKEGLTKPVKNGGWGIKKFNLDDLYVRFFRIAERRIVKGGRGVVSYISNFSYLGDPSFVVMRQRFMEEFDNIWIDCLNGDSRETGKRTPDGKPDPSVFSTDQSRVGIRVGTAICLLVRKTKRTQQAKVRFQHYWGVTKRQDLLDSVRLKQPDRKYEIAKPRKENRYSFKPSHTSEAYDSWPTVVDIAAIPPSNGLMEKRGGALIDIDRKQLATRMQAYFDKNLSWSDFSSEAAGLAAPKASYDPETTRCRAVTIEPYNESHLVRYALRPFDAVWAYYSTTPGLWNRNRPSYWSQCWKGNGFLLSRPSGVANPEGMPFSYVTVLGDNDYQRGHSYYFPFALKKAASRNSHKATGDIFGDLGEQTARANVSAGAISYLQAIGVRAPQGVDVEESKIWFHVLAIGSSPAYLSENADGIRTNWPRIPLPDNKKLLLSSAKLGEQIAALLDTENPVDGVTDGNIRPELRDLGVLCRVDDEQINIAAGDLDLTAGWGHQGKGGICMPGKGKYEVRQTRDSKQAKLLGKETMDVYLNESVFWSNVPKCVWDYYIGGYQVIKKWLSYREKSILGRGLELQEAEHVTNTVRRLAAIILLQPDLNTSYQSVKENTWPWPQS